MADALISRNIELLKLCAQRNETETKQFQNCFETVSKLSSVSFRSADSLSAVNHPVPYLAVAYDLRRR